MDLFIKKTVRNRTGRCEDCLAYHPSGGEPWDPRTCVIFKRAPAMRKRSYMPIRLPECRAAERRAKAAKGKGK